MDPVLWFRRVFFYGVGPIYWTKEIMNQYIYVKILQEIMLPYAREEMSLIWIFQQDNDPKHTSKLAKKWFRDNRIKVMKWPAQSPDLNPIENTCNVKKAVASCKPNNNEFNNNEFRTAFATILEFYICRKVSKFRQLHEVSMYYS